MDPAKAEELEAAMQDAESATVQPYEHSATPNAPLSHADSDAPLPNRSAPSSKLQLSKQAPQTRSSHLVRDPASASADAEHSDSKHAKLPKQASQKRSVRDVHAPLLPMADEEEQAEGRAKRQLAASNPKSESGMPESAAGLSFDTTAEQGETAAASVSKDVGNAQNTSVSNGIGAVQHPAGPSEAGYDSQHSVSPEAGQKCEQRPVSKARSQAAASKGTEAKQDDAGMLSTALQHSIEKKTAPHVCGGSVYMGMHAFVYLLLEVHCSGLVSMHNNTNNNITNNTTNNNNNQ